MTDVAHLRETQVRSTQVWRGDFLDVRRDEIALPDGAAAHREYIVHPGAVMIVPILDDGRLVVERQWRYPIGAAMLEFPAGKLEAVHEADSHAPEGTASPTTATTHRAAVRTHVVSELLLPRCIVLLGVVVLLRVRSRA